ncbi:head decoration protein [Sphingomonas sp. CBMAI 2297]|uniref:head decoration protein n=1 Tax=Sphingomonas sp. CBMAI 2297 TaxID=2991720 RepID=UPI002454ED14|nr:head decoration protein [Sphingomonas sp. CBMAI 2297]MDH4745830.1 head decoration protein [Sphingomonas sp. CBMAI 2297]
MTTFGAPPFQPGMTTDTYIPDQLIGGDLKIVTDNATITGGAIYKRGTVLGKITASGKLTQALAASNDGSQTPVTALVDDVDSTGGDVTGPVFRQAELNGNALILGTGITLSTAKAGMEAAAGYNLFIKSPVTAADPT